MAVVNDKHGLLGTSQLGQSCANARSLNGGVRIGSDRHKKKLKAEERRQQLSQQDQQTAKQPAAADEDDATQRKKQRHKRQRQWRNVVVRQHKARVNPAEWRAAAEQHQQRHDAARQLRARVVGDAITTEPRTRGKRQQYLQLEIEHLTKARYQRKVEMTTAENALRVTEAKMREMEEKTARAESTDEDRGSTGGRDEALARLQMALTTVEDTVAAWYLRQRIGAWNGVDESISYNGATGPSADLAAQTATLRAYDHAHCVEYAEVTHPM
eukprot:COSAG02_NODE_5596_length_4200_cov_4.631553_6_plen_270_part_00